MEQLKVDKAFLKIKGEPVSEIEKVTIEIPAEEVKKEAEQIGPQETLYMDENDRVYRINEFGDKVIVVSFENAEVEKAVKLELFMKKHFERIKAWHNSKGMETPPIAWDEKSSKYVWLNRKMRRA